MRTEPWDHSTYETQQRDLQRIMAIQESDDTRRAKRAVWATVFQIVSDNPQMATREFIKKLEAARGEDGCGPQ